MSQRRTSHPRSAPRRGGRWTEKKLQVVAKYLQAYCTALKKGIYVGCCAVRGGSLMERIESALEGGRVERPRRERLRRGVKVRPRRLPEDSTPDEIEQMIRALKECVDWVLRVAKWSDRIADCFYEIVKRTDREMKHLEQELEELKQANADLSVTRIELERRLGELKAQKVKGNPEQQESIQMTEESGALSTFERRKREEEEEVQKFEEIMGDMSSLEKEILTSLRKLKKENPKIYKIANFEELNQTLRKSVRRRERGGSS